MISLKMCYSESLDYEALGLFVSLPSSGLGVSTFKLCLLGSLHQAELEGMRSQASAWERDNNPMRLTNPQLTIIKQTVAHIFGMNTNVYLFGSRVDDMKKGGDVDLLIETQIKSKLLEKIRLKNELEAQLQLPVDLVITQHGKPLTPFQRIAFKHSILL